MSIAVTIVGGGLAGTECAWQLATRGVPVRLVEQKPKTRTHAQTGDGLCELVCSNSFRGAALTNAVGLLKEEMRMAGSLVMKVADETRVPAGGALAVDREAFSRRITELVADQPRIERICEAVASIPTARPLVLATGPLTGDALAADLARAVGSAHLAYYDAIAPIVSADSLDESKIFRASRYDKGGDDAYVNCPLNEEQYTHFVQELLAAQKVEPRAFEEIRYFEGCLPVEVMAERGVQTLAYGPMKPVGLMDPHTGKRPHAVVQLRAEDPERTAYNLVGFQTRMTYAEQKRVFSLIPGLEQAEFMRFGSVHRNTFVHSPTVLEADLSLKALPGVYLAGQITGVEGYMESAACGLMLGLQLAAELRGAGSLRPPSTTALGALRSHLFRASPRFQPSNILWSLFPPVDNLKLRKQARYQALAERALADLPAYLDAARV